MVLYPSALPPEPLRRLLDRSYPLCREDVIWALDHIKRKVAEGAPEWSGLDRPALLRHFACFADVALSLLHRRTLEGPEAACFRDLLLSLTSAASRDGIRLPYPPA